MFPNILKENAVNMSGRGSSNEKWAELLLIFGAYALDKNTAMLEKIGGSEWDIDSRRNMLIFKKFGPVKYQILGSYYRNHRQWIWSWAQADLFPTMTKSAVQLRTLGIKHNIVRLSTSSFECTKVTAHNIAFLASGCTPSSGYFALEMGDNTTFVLLDKSFLIYKPDAARIVQIFKTFSKMQQNNHKNAFKHYVQLNKFKCNIGENHIIAKRGSEQIIASFEKDRLYNIYY